MQFFFGGMAVFCLGELVGLAGQRVLPLTFLCDFSRLVAAASYIEGDVSPDGSVRAITGRSLCWGEWELGHIGRPMGAAYLPLN